MYNTYLDSEPLNTLISNAHKWRPFVLTWNVSSTFLLMEKHKEQERKTDGRNSNIFSWGLWCVNVQYTKRFFLISLSVREWQHVRRESVVPFLVFSRDQFQMWESGATVLQNPRGPDRLDMSTTEGCSKGPRLWWPRANLSTRMSSCELKWHILWGGAIGQDTGSQIKPSRWGVKKSNENSWICEQFLLTSEIFGLRFLGKKIPYMFPS